MQTQHFNSFLPPVKDRYFGLYFGIVEQRIDPARLGRLRVRIQGVHSGEIQTEDLPWATPNSPFAWKKGGFFGAPPLDEVVSILFIAGDPEHPVWMGGHWGAKPSTDQEAGASGGEPKTTEVADGKDEAKHFLLPSSMFGGKKNGNLLRKEDFAEAKEEDAPNNFGYASPLNKHFEFDDRKGRQKVKLSDQNDNMLWFNSEHSGTTWQITKGHQGQVTGPFGVTMNNDNDVLTWQIHASPGGTEAWSVTADIRKGFLELATPGLYKIVIDRRRRRLELWTGGGHHIVAADGMSAGEITALGIDEQTLKAAVEQRENATEPTLLKGLRDTSMPLRSTASTAMSSFICAKTSGGQMLVLGNSLGSEAVKTSFLSTSDGAYISLHESGKGRTSHVEVYSPGTMKFIAEADMHFKAKNGNIALDGNYIDLNSDIASATKIGDALAEFMGKQPWVAQPPETPRTVRAYDYPYFSDCEKIEGYKYPD